MAEQDRVRRKGKARKNLVSTGRLLEFANPYPWMSDPEALVHLELERRRVPFTWRYFDGDSANIRELMPDFHPEFTLREYRTVILIIGGFFGQLPGVLDRNALGIALLENDGWKVATLFEADIRLDVRKALDTACPQLIRPEILGAIRPNPFGIPDYMERRREQLRGFGLQRKKFLTEGEVTKARRGRRARRRDQ